MDQEGFNPNCPLFESQTCRRLNMRACRRCVAKGQSPEALRQIEEDVDTLYGLLPEPGLHSLFSGDTCALCRPPHAKKAAGYGLYDMGHSDPRASSKKTGLFRNRIYGFVVPLQFACCPGCRHRFLLLSWLTPLCTILTLGLTLAWVSQEQVAQSLRAAWRGLPLLLLAAAAAVGLSIGLLWTGALRRRFNKRTYIRLEEHPFVQQMQSFGWEALAEGRHPRPVFTGKRLAYGVGTACPEELQAEKRAQEEEISIDNPPSA